MRRSYRRRKARGIRKVANSRKMNSLRATRSLKCLLTKKRKKTKMANPLTSRTFKISLKIILRASARKTLERRKTRVKTTLLI